MITLYLNRLAARRAYTRAYNKDMTAYLAWQAGERALVWDERHVHACDVAQGELTTAWQALREANDAFNDACEAA
jgi:hypothetical protein